MTRNRLNHLKEHTLRRVAATLRHYAEHETLEQRVDRYRAMGVAIGERVAIFDSLLDPVVPHLLTIGDDCIITGTTILCHDASLIIFRHRLRAARVTVGDRVFIGLGTVVLPGVTIGSDVIIGAGSVVTRDVPDRTVAAGNPAKPIMPLDQWLAQRDTDPTVTREVAIVGFPIAPELLERLREATR